ncbi:hypothetical protein EVAR_103410_1 [Eumeta japonica]|uniref:Uncharacterized protein n=1 Tax=Eumeta variegata TaxID=151549 RepID=A0A4C1YWS8_EUMVA|nr:hypothetical protein EVAR_103410_1 [Eumeta japonica]
MSEIVNLAIVPLLLLENSMNILGMSPEQDAIRHQATEKTIMQVTKKTKEHEKNKSKFQKKQCIFSNKYLQGLHTKGRYVFVGPFRAQLRCSRCDLGEFSPLVFDGPDEF